MKTIASQRTVGLLIPLLLGIFLAATTGFDLLPQVGLFNGKRILEVFMLLALFGATALNPALRLALAELLGFLPRWIGFALGFAALAGTISALRFPHPGYGLLEIAMLAMLVSGLLATAAARQVCGNNFDRMALLVLISIGVISSVTELTGIIVAWLLGFEFDFNKMLVRFFHPRFYNQLQTFMIPLIATLPFIFGSSRKLKLIAIGLIGIQWCLVLVSGGRGTVVSLITAFTLAAILFPSNRRAWFRIHAAGLLAGVVIYLSLLAMNQSVVPGGEGFVSQSIGRPMAHTSGRINLWSIALDQATKQPLLGSGPSRYACGLDPNIAAHPHSFPMTVLSEMGFPAFTLLMLVCLWLGWQLLVRCRESQDGTLSSDTLIAMLGCSIMAATVHAMVSGVLIMPASQVMTILIGGWMLGTLNIQPTESPVNNRSAVLVLTISFVVAAAVSVFSVSELQKMNLRTSQERTKVLAEPRYWQMGRACNFTYDED